MKRKVRSTVDIILPLLGMGVIFGSVLFGSPDRLQFQVILLLFGVLILEAGVWGVTSALLPNERRFPALRHEVNHFLGLIRVLNAAAIARELGFEDEGRVQETLREMHSVVDRMAEVAGRGSLGDLHVPLSEHALVEPGSTSNVAGSTSETPSKPGPRSWIT